MFGVPDETNGEVCVALVVRRNGAGVGEQELVNWVNNHMAEESRIIAGVKFVTQLPHGGTLGKKMRRRMQAL